MEKWLGFVARQWQELAGVFVAWVVALAVALIARRLLFGALHRWAARAPAEIDDLVVNTLQKHSLLWVFILASHLAVETATLPEKLSQLIARGFFVLWAVSITLVLARLAAGVVKHYGTRVSGAQPVTTLTQNLARLIVVALGLVIILNELGVSVAPILTALGVGGLAVALALQDTLSNLFAGLYVSLAGQIRVGDYIKLNTGEEGYVDDISWRSTSVRALPNNLILVPNAKLAQAIVTNYHLPEKRMSLLIPVGVSYDEDPDVVERILLEEARLGAGEIPGLLAHPEPSVRFIPGFGESSLNFTLICQVAEFVDQYLAQHELRKRILRRFRREGIQIPFPVRTLVVRREEAPPPHGPDGDVFPPPLSVRLPRHNQ